MIGNLFLAFDSPTTFSFTYNGKTYAFNTSAINQVIVNGPVSNSSWVTFYDPQTSDAYTAHQTFSSTTLVRNDGSFELDAENVATFYAYVADPDSSATVDLSDGAAGSYYVDAATGDYTYIADPTRGIFSELSGFGAETVAGAGGSNYAYIYSNSNASFDGDADGSTFISGGFLEQDEPSPGVLVISTVTTQALLTHFPQLYLIGASDGTDQATLHAEGGSFVATPTFSYVSGNVGGSNYLIGTLYAANVQGIQDDNSSGPATFYSYADNQFNGNIGGNSSLQGSATNASGLSYQFTVSASAFKSITVFESGTGTDVANLTSLPGGSSVFNSTPTVSTLAGDGMVITVNTFGTIIDFIAGSTPTIVPLPNQIVVNSVGSETETSLGDTLNLYDGVGTNAIVASGSTAKFTNSTSNIRLNLDPSSLVLAYQENGDNDSLDVGSIDFALQAFGNWISI